MTSKNKQIPKLKVEKAKGSFWGRVGINNILIREWHFPGNIVKTMKKLND